MQHVYLCLDALHPSNSKQAAKLGSLNLLIESNSKSSQLHMNSATCANLL
jgi:hypothetical protein